MDIIKYFENRISLEHLRKRLELQVAHSAFRFGDKKFFSVYLENIEWIFVLLKWILILLGLYNRGQKNTIQYSITENKYKIKNLPASFHGFRILHLSDLHIDKIFDSGKTLFNALDGLKYDICVITGDYRFNTYGDYSIVTEKMKELKSHLNPEHGVYCILGNHDFLEFVPYFEELGYKFLLNEQIIISREQESLEFFGIDDVHYYKTVFFKAGKSNFSRILLAHSPEIIPEAEEEGFQMYLCGHTHGGQICLPGEIPILLNANANRKYLSGKWLYKNMHGYTSRGTGSSGLDVRFFCQPEIAIHELICY